MVVGAVCRDVLHLASGHTSSLRSTSDLDLALAVDSWSTYRRLTAQLQSVRTASQIRYVVAGTAVDIIPFGDLEDPDGQVPTGTHAGPMNVLGFGDVWRAAAGVDLPGGSRVRVPTIAGYAALKLSAWASRSLVGELKDGPDLACAMFWYQRSAGVHDRLYDEAREAQVLIRAELDEPLAAVSLLVADALDCLTLPTRQDLRALWARSAGRVDLLATCLANTRLAGWPRRGPRLVQYAEAIAGAVARM